MPLAVAWAGSGTMFAASLYGLLVVLGRRASWRRTPRPPRAWSPSPGCSPGSSPA
ncbi:hypothetical protein ACFQY7_54790 [Actinomadura luteofluorescens]|uniref:hypothetical protein n=1 Tax=Actinomadura luteofluorescens TaxID=46163 RepID=UPI0036449172